MNMFVFPVYLNARGIHDHYCMQEEKGSGVVVILQELCILCPLLIAYS